MGGGVTPVDGWGCYTESLLMGGGVAHKHTLCNTITSSATQPHPLQHNCNTSTPSATHLCNTPTPSTTPPHCVCDLVVSQRSCPHSPHCVCDLVVSQRSCPHSPQCVCDLVVSQRSCPHSPQCVCDPVVSQWSCGESVSCPHREFVVLWLWWVQCLQ